MNPDSPTAKTGNALVVIIWLLRLCIGGLFIFSGFVKAVDPWGFLLKTEEYFQLIHYIPPRSITLVLSLGLSILEFVCGCVVAVGSYRRLGIFGMSVFMAVMLPLTAYLYIADPIPDCGCFGDAWVLTNGETFVKNIIIVLMLIPLWIYNVRVPGLLSRRLGWTFASLSFLYALAVGLVGYNVQPVVDFRPYPEGESLLEEDNDENVRYAYTDGTSIVTFSPDSLPNGDGWEFIERIEPDKNEFSDKVLAAYMPESGDDSDDILPEIIGGDSGNGVFLLVIPERERADISGTFLVNEIAEASAGKGIGFYGLLGGEERDIDEWADLSMASYPILYAEDTALKQLVRGTMALVFVKDGKVVWKRTVSSLPDDFLKKDFPDNPGISLQKIFTGITGTFILFTVLIFGTQMLLRGRRR